MYCRELAWSCVNCCGTLTLICRMHHLLLNYKMRFVISTLYTVSNNTLFLSFHVISEKNVIFLLFTAINVCYFFYVCQYYYYLLCTKISLRLVRMSGFGCSHSGNFVQRYCTTVNVIVLFIFFVEVCCCISTVLCTL